MIHQFETHGKATLVDCATGESRECVSVVTYSPLGAETWLYIEEDTGDLVGAERIDADGWHDMGSRPHNSGGRLDEPWKVLSRRD